MDNFQQSDFMQKVDRVTDKLARYIKSNNLEAHPSVQQLAKDLKAIKAESNLKERPGDC